MSVQVISPRGGVKRFLPGSRVAGGRFELGSHRYSEHRWYVEGFATGLSVRAALRALSWRDSVVVCFSDFGVLRLAKGDARAYVIADHDHWGCPSCPHRWSAPWDKARCPNCGETNALRYPAGEKAARATERPWWRPPEKGDANDFHQTYGLEALIGVMEDLRRRAGEMRQESYA